MARWWPRQRATAREEILSRFLNDASISKAFGCTDNVFNAYPLRYGGIAALLMGVS
jgi:hypothetical protein